MKALRISDSVRGFLSLDLADIVNVLRPVLGRDVLWCIRFWEGQPLPFEDLDDAVITVVKKVMDGRDVVVGDEELRTFCSGIAQTYDAFLETEAVAVECFDSTYWDVRSDSEDVLAAVAARFRDVQEMEKI
jgi:hypothetical protein